MYRTSHYAVFYYITLFYAMLFYPTYTVVCNAVLSYYELETELQHGAIGHCP